MSMSPTNPSRATDQGESTLRTLFTSEQIDRFARLMSTALLNSLAGKCVPDEEAFLIAADAVRPDFCPGPDVRFELRQMALTEMYELVKHNLCGPDAKLAADFDLRFFRI